MKIIDLHCDALLKLWEGKGTRSFATSNEIDANIARLKEGQVMVQCFAIFIEPEISADQQFQAALQQVDYFYHEVLGKNPEMKHIKNWGDFYTLEEGEIGAMLTLEGVEAIGNDFMKLRMLAELGVMSIGLTWNHANLAADGAGEPRGGGLTLFGKEIVQFNNERKILTDVSHLSERAFWDVMDLANYPIASHSNAKALCDHPRNLTDEQAKAMFSKESMIHVVYYPFFVSDKDQVTISDLVRHIDHLCALGGVHHIGLGSDFDGIASYITGLEHAGKTQNLINELLKYYKEHEVRGFAYQNFINHLPK
ncbi:dipeptidase [Cytobacillus spongiae]|uniref:dipeptidase n=1 Tax=Cytobacillus spongiae TaxID=2901381 RepID=UPI001F1D8157|nr:dipeptidase [Cytobacillus spongiae]UII57751.1 dipeptidase [Cytobacillus spongiae]